VGLFRGKGTQASKKLPEDVLKSAEKLFLEMSNPAPPKLSEEAALLAEKLFGDMGS
jgi:hypothetical protein